MQGLWQILEQLSNLDAGAVAGLSPAAIFFLLVILTFLTEDGACLLAGALAASGVISLGLGISACFAGIFVGDMGLYFLGRGFGASLSKTRLFGMLISERGLERASHWLEKRGIAAIFISRFVAGLRLPTYLAAGFLKVDVFKFAFYFVIAAAVWTPMIVIGAYYAQEYLFGTNLLIGIIALFLIVRFGMILASGRKRKMFFGSLRRVYRWEFWPVQFFYFPVVLYIGFLAVRHWSLTAFTCANPGIEAGGFVGESKNDIYGMIEASAAAAPFFLKHELISAGESSGLPESLEFPIVVKPDVGERGKQVTIARDQNEYAAALKQIEGDRIVQEFAEGDEFSVFYYKIPGDECGSIFSITEKMFPEVMGDGISSLEALILRDPRAVMIAGTYLDEIDDPDYVPENGERVRLVEIGTHARGAIFNDGIEYATLKLAETIDSICRGIDGFYFGRFDLRTPDKEAFLRGTGFKIIELNGVTSESTNIYDRKFSIFDAYSILFRQWDLAFRIGKANIRSGAAPTGAFGLIKLWFRSRGD